MTKHTLKTTILSLLLVAVFFLPSNGQPTTSQTTNPIHPPQTTGQYPKIVRNFETDSEVVHCELLDKAGNLWFSITGEGVYRYDGTSFTNFTVKDGLCNNQVGPIIQDKAGNILFGTKRGICKYDGSTFVNIPMTDSLSITSLLEDREGNIWFGVMNKGIYKYDGTSLSNFLYAYKHPFYGDNIEGYISDIIQDRKGNIWFSSWNGGGVWRYDGTAFKNFLPSLDYYTSNQDKRRLGNIQNSSELILDFKFFVQSENDMADDMIFSMTEDHLGNIWFATRNHGVSRFDGQIFKGFGSKEGFLSGGAYAILEDKKGNLWFTTEMDGVWRYDGTTFTNFNETDGLVNNAVLSALEDEAGNLWFGTKGCGLSRYDGKTFTTFCQGKK